MTARAHRRAATTAGARRWGLAVLRHIGVGQLELAEPDGRVWLLGPGGEPRARVEIRDERAWNRLMRHGSRGLADGYADRLWESPDVTAVIRLGASNMPIIDRLRRRVAFLLAPYQRLRGAGAASTREDIHHHYDIGTDLFELMLDESMMYSSAYFATPETALADAAIAKLELVCEKLGLGPEDHVIEIGSGWGGFAIHAAATRGCRVTTTTISGSQHAHATARVAAAGLADRVTVLRRDYRQLSGKYSALVSLEMIEAVGWRGFDTFLAKCADLLTRDGAMLLQAITTDDRAYELEKASKSFIGTYVFPNGCLPSQQVLANGMARGTDFRTVHHEDLTSHYVTTLRHWRRNFEAHAGRLRALGYDDRFQRLWRLYLSYCEAGFEERRIAVGQTLLAKPGWRRPVPATATARVVEGVAG